MQSTRNLPKVWHAFQSQAIGIERIDKLTLSLHVRLLKRWLLGFDKRKQASPTVGSTLSYPIHASHQIFETWPAGHLAPDYA